ncbi:uncharacterized protein TNIN_120311 [Trichonephila inaurata madagascariensis]|uniref:Reverse transcriptase domain-containing protein n=1 Tax=Trichonephila inaurata madagascariensis TaxID=2747483 RepID=A0A8X6ID53_9ARAC|nr:uncharacterized protein TNIN_120311 [Trichonephila inaurata madagascariensis]
MGKESSYNVFSTKEVFGISSSPFLLGATIEFHLNNAPPHLQETSFKLKNSFYVDNCILSVNSVEECSKFISESQGLMSTAEFNLRGWECFHKLLELNNPDEETKVVPVLGLNWNLPSDTFSIDVKYFSGEKGTPVTKRQVLSAVHRIFDPIGFTCPITLTSKLLLQECWRMGIS